MPLGAWVEVFRKTMLLAEPEVRQRSLFSVQLGRDVRLANLTSLRALAFGVTASLGAGERCEESQAFAVSAVHAGFGGIRYLLRHDPAQHLYGVALFAEAGVPATTDRAWPVAADGPIPDALVVEARRRFGYRVLPVP